MDTKIFFQCRKHKKLLAPRTGHPSGPFLQNLGGMDEYLTVMWDNMECPKGKRECVRKWRVVLVESGQVLK